MAVHESDICIIGGGISSAMLAQKLAALKPGLSITVVEAGRSISDVQNRGKYRQRAIDTASIRGRTTSSRTSKATGRFR